MKHIYRVVTTQYNCCVQQRTRTDADENSEYDYYWQSLKYFDKEPDAISYAYLLHAGDVVKKANRIAQRTLYPEIGFA